jgi:hypothetical protein
MFSANFIVLPLPKGGLRRQPETEECTFEEVKASRGIIQI